MSKLRVLLAVVWLGLTACTGDERATSDGVAAEAGGEKPSDGAPPQATGGRLAEPNTEPVTLASGGICVGQRAAVPRSRMVHRDLTGANTPVERIESSVDVFYLARND